MIGEYSPWDGDPGGRFTDRLLDWAESHRRVRMLIYYRSVTANNSTTSPTTRRRAPSCAATSTSGSGTPGVRAPGTRP